MPLTCCSLARQGGHFDLADRMFHSVREAWYSASKHNMADVKELIPEFFYLPEFLLNSNNFDLGRQKELDSCAVGGRTEPDRFQVFSQAVSVPCKQFNAKCLLRIAELVPEKTSVWSSVFLSIWGFLPVQNAQIIMFYLEFLCFAFFSM